MITLCAIVVCGLIAASIAAVVAAEDMPDPDDRDV